MSETQSVKTVAVVLPSHMTIDRIEVAVRSLAFGGFIVSGTQTLQTVM